jgi:hypothetical protein
LEVGGWKLGSCFLFQAQNEKKIENSGYFSLSWVLTSKSFNNQTKKNTMKKLLLVLAVGAFVACNNGGGEEPTGDTTAVPPTGDTTIVTPPGDTTIVVPGDTTKKDTSAALPK